MHRRHVSTSIAFLAVLALAACGDAPVEAGAIPPGSERAIELFKTHCGMCHGSDGAGTKLAPTLRDKAKHWKREDLLQYLREPQAYAAKVPRLVEQGKRYTLPMTSFKARPQNELEALADQALAFD